MKVRIIKIGIESLSLSASVILPSLKKTGLHVTKASQRFIKLQSLNIKHIEINLYYLHQNNMMQIHTKAHQSELRILRQNNYKSFGLCLMSNVEVFARQDGWPGQTSSWTKMTEYIDQCYLYIYQTDLT